MLCGHSGSHPTSRLVGEGNAGELGIGLVPYSPLGRGFLTRTAKRAEEMPADDWRAKGDPRLQGKNFDENMKLAELVRQFAEEKSATPGQVALAWLLRKVSGSRYNPADLAAINR
jgi:aryl-alcohol dehydrogenase-like predicted oxidoreductase